MDRKAAPVDLDVLARQSGGDVALERDVLLLFTDQAARDASRLVGLDMPARRALAHRIVGSARAIGAGEVARRAAAIEAGDGDIAALEDAIGQACQFIVGHLARLDRT
jgi:HPt (histidine-containing phosphotransfer) domain-containing protein